MSRLGSIRRDDVALAAGFGLLCLSAPSFAGRGPQPGFPCGYEVAAIIQAPECPPPFFTVPVVVPTSMNSRGDVTGFYDGNTCVGGTDEGFLWTAEDGFFTIPRPVGVLSVHPTDINDHQVIVGSCRMTGIQQRAFVYDHGTWTFLPAASSGGWSFASAINNHGIVCGARNSGQTRDQINPDSAFTWSLSNGFTDLGLVRGLPSIAQDISESGIVAGFAGGIAAFENIPFTWSNGRMTTLPLPRGGYSVRAGRILESGQVLGSALFFDDLLFISSYHLSIVWDHDGLILLDPLPGFASSGLADMNSSGIGVGWCPNPGFDEVSLVWHQYKAIPLQPLVHELPNMAIPRAIDINDSGQVLAIGVPLSGIGDTAGVLLKPLYAVADLTSDCRVEVNDLGVLLSAWGLRNHPADFNQDGVVDGIDLGILLVNWTSK